MLTISVTTRAWEIFFVLASFLYLDFQKQAPSPSPPQPSTQEGLQLLHKMLAALGGAETIASTKDYEETLRAETWNNSGVPLGEVRKRARWIRSPNVLRLDQIGPRDTYVLYFDGQIVVLVCPKSLLVVERSRTRRQRDRKAYGCLFFSEPKESKLVE